MSSQAATQVECSAQSLTEKSAGTRHNTGALSAGIGAEMVWVLARAGAEVLLLARNVSAGDTVVQKINAAQLKARLPYTV